MGLYLIAANDSHYIYPEQSKERLELLKGKGIQYNDEDSFILDYPSYSDMCKRFDRQGLFSRSQIIDIIDQTLILDDCEDIDINKNIKMPTIYGHLNDQEKINLLQSIINDEFDAVMEQDRIPKEKHHIYREELNKEMQVVKDTAKIHTSDYFLFNHDMVRLAVDKYGGVLTRSGRGSGGAFLINKILGITQIDRLSVDLPIYSERFASSARLLENHALPDIDFNVSSQEPFVSASKELLGEYGCYPMVAYGTMKISEAFRNVCRSHELPYETYNEVGKEIERYMDNPDWKPYIDEANRYVDTIISASVHPCAHVLSNDDIEEEIGVAKIGDAICALITSSEADEWKYLKNDYLIVTVWDIIDKVFKEIHKPIMSIRELRDNLSEKEWNLFATGTTATLNQVDGDWATSMLKDYKPKTLEELSMFVGAIRPSFNSFRDDFIARRPYTNGCEALDILFKQTGGRVIFQENLMQYFEWLGVTPAESIGLIKKISKKKIKPADFEKLTDRLRKVWIEKVGNDNQFDELWGKMQSMMAYGFNSPHGLATAIDSLYCAYLKVNYPIEYYTVTLNIYSKSEDKTMRLTEEVKKFKIKFKSPKFRYSRAEYSYDKTNNVIYKGVGSIKNMNAKVAEELYAMKDMEFKNFVDVLYAIKEHTSLNSRQLDILVKIGYFSEFGATNILLYAINVFNQFYKCKTIKIDKLNEMCYNVDMVKTCCGKATEKTLSQIDNRKLVLTILRNSKLPKTTIVDCIRYQIQFLGYTDYSDPNVDTNKWVVTGIENTTYGTIWLTLYNIAYGATRRYKVVKQWNPKNPAEVGDVIMCVFQEKDKFKKDENGNFVKTGEKETQIKCYKKDGE